MRQFFCLILLCFTFSSVLAQNNLCTGSKGLPIFYEDFGSGNTHGPQLPVGYTNYNFVNSGVPEDGQYTIAVPANFNNNWHSIQDHTPNDVNGKALIVNASNSAGEFYRRTVTGLCPNTTFEFTAWVVNMYNPRNNICPNNGIPINVKFEIWDENNTTLLESVNTNNINGNLTPSWEQFGLTFTTLADQTSVVLIMKNNGAGGCGNDLAIDDIMFRSCGVLATIENDDLQNEINICSENLPMTLDLAVISQDSSQYFYQWQKSEDGEIWENLPGENSINLSVTVLGEVFFRSIIAQDVTQLNNPFCYTISEVFSVSLDDLPDSPISNGNVFVCGNDPIPDLSVQEIPGVIFNWYDRAIGGNLLQANSSTFSASTSGVYFAEAAVDAQNCVSPIRTAVSLSFAEKPITFDSVKYFCEGQFVDLDAIEVGVTYLWNTGEITKNIRVDIPGNYSVTMSNAAGCFATKNILVIQRELPVIQQVVINDRIVTVILENEGDFEYKLDGLDYQSSNVFNHVVGGIRQIFVRERNGCGERNVKFNLFIVPKYFSPNNDGFNDTFKIEGNGLEHLVKLEIIDRTGQLITVLNEFNPSWDGTVNGNLLPATDYWYRAIFENSEVQTGHFSLIR